MFLGAGAISSTAILMRSLGLYDREVRFSDSQYYTVSDAASALRPARQPRNCYHTLSQGFIEIFDKTISPFGLHLQVYSYNDHLDQILDHKLGVLKYLFPKNLLLGRFLLVQGYLHSDHSSAIVGRLRREGGEDVFDLSELLNPETRPKIAQVLGKLTRHALSLGAAPLAPLLQVQEAGRGFHTGGSFPMAVDPGPGQTDRLGRPHRASRIHVVDATVFPTIPATTITLTVMANAHRIAGQKHRTSTASRMNLLKAASPMSPVVAITGANGYVGSLIARALVAQANVVSLVRRPRAPEDMQWSFDADPAVLETAFRRRGVTHLIHAAWDMKANSLSALERDCVAGSARLFAAASAAGVLSRSSFRRSAHLPRPALLMAGPS